MRDGRKEAKGSPGCEGRMLGVEGAQEGGRTFRRSLRPTVQL